MKASFSNLSAALTDVADSIDYEAGYFIGDEMDVEEALFNLVNMTVNVKKPGNIYRVTLQYSLVLISEEMCITISEEIKDLRVRLNISQAELARRLGTSPQNSNAKMKKGSFSIEDMKKIAEVTNMDFLHGFKLENGDII